MSDDWVYDEMNGWINSEDDPAMASEAALLDEIERLGAEVVDLTLGQEMQIAAAVRREEELDASRREWMAKAETEHALADQLAEALSFYADPATYHAIGFWFDQPCGDFANDFDSEHGDFFYEREMPGKTARTALAAHEEARRG